MRDFRIPEGIPEKHVRILKMMKEGKSSVEIRLETGLSDSGVNYILNTYRLYRSRPKNTTQPRNPKTGNKVPLSPDHSLLGLRIRDIRFRRGFAEKAKLVEEAKISHQRWSFIEDGTVDVTYSELVKITQALGVSMLMLFDFNYPIENFDPIDTNPGE